MKEGNKENLQCGIEQYTIYVRMADQVSARRNEANKFYISLLTALLALLSILLEGGFTSIPANITLLAVSVLGVLLCIVWMTNIRSYSQLNSGKFKVIHEMEDFLPFQCYKREWELLGKGSHSNRYLQLTRVEQVVPLIMALPYLGLLVYSILALINNW